MYPHERSLVTRLKDKPFVLVGVNADTDREQIKQRIKDEQISWRSWWDQPEARTDGRIPPRSRPVTRKRRWRPSPRNTTRRWRIFRKRIRRRRRRRRSSAS